MTHLDYTANLANLVVGHQANVQDVHDPLSSIQVWAGGFIDTENFTEALNAQLGVNTSGGAIRRGKLSIATEESRTSTSYGTMPTPDQIQSVVLGSTGLLLVGFSGMFKSSGNSTGSAALFLNSTQLKTDAGSTAPSVAEVGTTGTDSYRHLISAPSGLISGAGVWTGDVTTGQLLVTGSAGGFAVIFADAGTYTVSVQYKATSGSVTAKNRNLWVTTMGF